MTLFQEENRFCVAFRVTTGKIPIRYMRLKVERILSNIAYVILYISAIC